MIKIHIKKSTRHLINRILAEWNCFLRKFLITVKTSEQAKTITSETKKRI